MTAAIISFVVTVWTLAIILFFRDWREMRRRRAAENAAIATRWQEFQKAKRDLRHDALT
jgi:predicted Holliday junction resolvase-like endonuclease